MTSYLPHPAALVSGNRVELLRDGTQAYPRMMEAIGGATHSVLVEMYTFASDASGWLFARALADRARSGIQVRVLYDGVGCRDTSTELWSHLRLAGASVTAFRPPGWFSLRRRDHRKMIVVDGKTAFVGGLNLADEYAAGWRDTQAEIEGPAVADLCRLFQETWEREEDDPLWRPDPPTRSAPVGTAPVALFSANLWSSRRSIAAAYLQAFRKAARRIWIANAYFIPGVTLRRALKEAARRGVDVRVLVPGETDAWPVHHASRHAFAGLLKAGVRIFVWQGPMMHCKTAVVDGFWSTVGSYNLDHLSLVRNQELAVVIEEAGVGAAMERMYEEDLAQAQEVSREDWGRRPFSAKLLENFWHFFRSGM